MLPLPDKTNAKVVDRGPVDALEKEWVKQALQGDQAAFSKLVSAYSGRIFAVALRILGDRGEAEDMTQDIFVVIFKSLNQFRGDSKLSTWIYRVAKNRCLNRLQFLKRRHVGMHKDIHDPIVENRAFVSAKTPDALKRLETQDLSTLLEAHLRLLPDDQRILIVLRDLQSQSYDDIAKIMELPLGTVKSKIHRARSALSKSLGPVLRPQEPLS